MLFNNERVDQGYTPIADNPTEPNVYVLLHVGRSGHTWEHYAFFDGELWYGTRSSPLGAAKCLDPCEDLYDPTSLFQSLGNSIVAWRKM